MLNGQLTLTANGNMPGHYMEQYISTKTVEDAEDTFVDAKERLLDVNHWNRYCGVPGVFFSLTDGHSRLVSRKAHKGDHIKINAPAIAECCLVIDSIEYDDYPDLGMESFTLRLHRCAHHEDEEEGDYGGAVASLIIERRHKHVFSVYNYRNDAGEPVKEFTDDCFGLTDSEWSGMLKRFVL